MTLIRRSTKHASADLLRRRRDAPADHRRGGGPGRADRHRHPGAARSRTSTRPRCFGALLQHPGTTGVVRDLAPTIAAVHAAGGLVAVATDLLACTLLVPPGEQGADVVVGSSQRFGVPLGYGGPHAGFLATREDLRRSMPGRLVGRVRRRRRSPRPPPRAPDPRAAHPPGEGHVEHLHRAGAPGRDRLDVRRVPRARGPDGDRRAGPPPRRLAGPVAGGGRVSRSTATSSTRSPCGCRRRRRGGRRRAAPRGQPAQARRPHRRGRPRRDHHRGRARAGGGGVRRLAARR